MRPLRISTLVLLFWAAFAPVAGTTGPYAITFYGSDSSCTSAVETVTIAITTLGEYSNCVNWAGGCTCVRSFVGSCMRACVCACMRACVHACICLNTLHTHCRKLRVCRPQTDKMMSAKFQLQGQMQGQDLWKFKGYSEADCSGSSSSSSGLSTCIGSSSKGYVTPSAGTAPPTPPTPVSQR